MSDNGAGVVNLSAGSGRHTTSDLTGRPRNLSEWGIPVTAVVANYREENGDNH